MARKIQPRSKVPKPKRGQSSEDYWRERESRQRTENIRNEAKTAERINRIFQSMQDSIQQEIEVFYQRYASKEGITLTEARGRVSRIDMEQYERLAKKYVEAAHHGNEDLAFSQEANDQMRLYNATMRINRLEMLKARCGIRAMEGYRDTERLINENLEERAYSEYSRLAGILGNSVQFNENMVRAIVNASYQNATWSQRLWNHQASLSSQIGTQLASGILAGKSSTVLAREIQKLTGGSTYACQRLMRTELRRVQTEAALQSMTDNGVAEYKYLVANGVNPCDECLALDGQVFKLSDMNVGKNAPPMHPQCVLPGTKIIAPGMEAIMRSEYSGDVVEIGTASGARLSVTPNHIVLTERGWIRAKNIVKGDKVIHYAGRGEHGVEVHPANDDCIPAVEELFTAFIKAGGVSPLGVPASTVDFKGDVVPQSKVDVVFINSKLRDEVDASVSKHGGYGPFIRAIVIGERGLDTESPLNKALIWYGLAADGIMSRLSERGIFLGSSIRCADLVRFRTTADYNARLLQVSTDNGSTDIVSISKSIFTNSRLVISNDNLEDVSGQFNGGVRRNSELNSVLDQDALNCFGSFMDDVCNVTKVFAGIVQFDDVVDVTSRFYSGHVYDTSCMSTLYTANGIITSNCHCATAPYVDEAKWQRWLDGPAQAGVPWAEFENRKSAEDLAERRRQRLAERRAKKENQSAVEFDPRVSEKQVDIIKSLENEYKTRLQKVTVGANKRAGTVDITGALMKLNSNSLATAIHEFAHTLTSTNANKFGLTNDSDFWKEIRKIRTDYRKDINKSQDVTKWISHYEHSSNSLDEFLAEAFAHAKMRQLGLPNPREYGNDYTYSQKVLDVVNKYFKKVR